MAKRKRAKKKGCISGLFSLMFLPFRFIIEVFSTGLKGAEKKKRRVHRKWARRFGMDKPRKRRQR